MRAARLLPLLLATSVASLASLAAQTDWLLDPAAYRASILESDDHRELTLDNGLLRLRVRLDKGPTLVSLEQRSAGQQLLRAAAPLGAFTLSGVAANVGGMRGQPDRAFLRDEWLDTMTTDPDAFAAHGSVAIAAIAERFPWRRTRPVPADVSWPPAGQHVAIACAAPPSLPRGVTATVHLELYDGLPLFAHWLELHNGSDAPIEVDAFASLRLPIVEAESRVETERVGMRLPNLHVETDYAFHAMTGADGSSHCVRWLPDPAFATQVNYERATRCLLEVAPDRGPAQTVPPGGTFATFRTLVLAPDSEDRDRQSLALRRMYRALAPWSTENPLMMHLRSAAPTAVRTAIDQCAAVGFEMAILSFGSGFDMEDDSQANLDRWKELADYAHGKGVQIGGYSLLSSRRIEPDGDNCIDRATGKPGGQVFGFAPALASGWGQRYFGKLRHFLDYTGFDLLEHDGSYPGDSDAAARPPLQKGWDDSRWVQYAIIAEFYRWCRGRGIYLNVPDWYFLQGSNKTGMGYRETNWSLPRELQVVHARQNLFDGTRDKNASMGWMFVPLTEYHGGGAAATIEPLADHLPHYELMLASNLGYGAQACWRGPRLYDTGATRALVARWVDWYRAHRAILEAPVIHGSSRRADGRDLDWVLHADPRSDPPAMLVVWNPTANAIERELPLDLTFAGLTARAAAIAGDGAHGELALDARSRGRLAVQVMAGGIAWFELRAAR